MAALDIVRNAVLASMPARVTHWLNVRKNIDLWPVEPELRIAPLLVEPGSEVIDVGGHLGLYAVVFARVASRVFVFEPQRACVAHLRAVLDERCTILPVAAGDRSALTELRIPHRAGLRYEAWSTIAPGNGFAALGADRVLREPVVVVTIDSLADSYRDLTAIKLDVEGHELAVLRGAEDTLARFRPTLLAEVSPLHNRAWREVFAHLAARGYAAYKLGRVAAGAASADGLASVGLHRFDPDAPLPGAEPGDNYVFVHGSRRAALASRLLARR
jgi:FkbM family methyltransferase